MQEIKINSETLDKLWQELASEAISNAKSPSKPDALDEFNNMIDKLYGFRIKQLPTLPDGRDEVCVVTNQRLAVDFILKNQMTI